RVSAVGERQDGDVAIGRHLAPRAARVDAYASLEELEPTRVGLQGLTPSTARTSPAAGRELATVTQGRPGAGRQRRWGGHRGLTDHVIAPQRIARHPALAHRGRIGATPIRAAGRSTALR